MERRGKQSSEPLRVAIVIFPGFQTLDALGPLEVFATAGELAARTGAAAATGSAYRVEFWAERAGVADPKSSTVGMEAPTGEARHELTPFGISAPFYHARVHSQLCPLNPRLS